MIYGWILFSVIAQTIVLSYMNFVYLPGRGTVRATLYEENAPAVKNRSFRLPEGTEKAVVSFDGIYVAYTAGNKLVIVNLDSKKTLKELSPSDGIYLFQVAAGQGHADLFHKGT